MLELIQLLETVYRTISADLEEWFKPFPEGWAWNVFSDYCIGDPKKKNDVFAFTIVLNHDTQANLEEFIAAVAPSDIKGSRSSSESLIEYLGCPVVFSISYLVQKQSKLLRDYMTDDHLRDALADMRQVVGHMAEMIPEQTPYYRAVDKRLKSFEKEMKMRARNSNLARQIFLISDRDAIFDKHDKVVFDLAFLYFHLHRMMKGQDALESKLLFGLPGWDGINQYAEFIRLPD